MSKICPGSSRPPSRAGSSNSRAAARRSPNKHGFLPGDFQAAVRSGLMASNPRQGRRLPHTRVEETVFLTPPEFVLLRDNIERDRWKNLATWLVTTGMRFSEGTALTAADIDANQSDLQQSPLFRVQVLSSK
jgi:integrase